MMSAPQSDLPVPSPQGERTTIFKHLADGGEIAVGYVAPDGGIYKLRWDEGRLVGRIEDRSVYRRTTHDERELGYFTAGGQIYSHGLFTGGALGWVDEDGVVVQAGLILGEEEAGRGEGPELYAAGAALLLIFLPDDFEENRRQ
jgi:hypothetical protein